jgi:predicted permease
LQNLRGIDPGFDTNNILNFNVDSTLTRYTGERLGEFYRELRDRFREIPGVVSAGYSDSPLLSGSLGMTSFHFHGNQDEKESSADVLGVGPGFFSTMKMPLTAGRDFAPREYVADVEQAGPLCPNSPKSVVVNESFVRSFFPNGSPLGQRFGGDNPVTPDPKHCKNLGWEVVGVVRDAKYNDLRRKINATIYEPLGESGTFELRTASDPRAVIPAVREVLVHSGFDLPIFGIKTESQSIDQLLFTERLIARLASLFGLLALLLACIGLYGLLSYDVTRRTREIGISMALGAQSGDVLRRVVRHGIALVAIGAAVGTAASISLTRYLGSLLYNVKPSDPLTLTAVTVLLLVVALAACYIPAIRATRVDPLVALRYE